MSTFPTTTDMGMNFPVSSDTPLGTLTRHSDEVWLLELKNGRDNRLTGVVCRDVILAALDVVERQWRQKGKGPGALVIAGDLSQEKFFSNGFDIGEIFDTPGYGFIFNSFVPVLQRLLQFPIPTIAAINGHAFAAGFVLAMACDYRVMTSQKAWASMNEVHLGGPFPRSFVAMFQEKVKSPELVRKIALEGHRFTPQELLELRMVDQIVGGGSKGVLEGAVQLAGTTSKNASTGVWGLIKKELYATTLARIGDDVRMFLPFEDDAIAEIRLKTKL